MVCLYVISRRHLLEELTQLKVDIVQDGIKALQLTGYNLLLECLLVLGKLIIPLLVLTTVPLLQVLF